MPRGRRGHVNVAQVLEKLGRGRNGLIQISREAVINSPEYKAADKAVIATDDVVEELTGNRKFFHEKGSGDHTPR